MIKSETTTLSITGGILGLAAIGLIGFKIPPRNYPSPPQKTKDIGEFNLPEDLPAPVSRHFLAALGVTPPRMETAVVWGRAHYKKAGIWFPMRFRSYYNSGDQYLREMQFTWYGFPMFNKFHFYKNETAAREISGLTHSIQSGSEVKQALFLSMWAEAVWMPGIMVSNQLIRWEAIDEFNARLVVQFDESDEPFLVRFNPESGLIEEITAWRFRRAGGNKTAWRIAYSNWKVFHGLLLPRKIITSWEDTGAYAVFKADGLEYNLDISSTFSID